MALKKMTVEEMIPVSAPWVSAGNVAHRTIEKIPLLAALLPQLQAAHSAIFAVRVQTEDPKVQRLSQQEADLDAKHDALVRGIYGSLTMLAQVSSTSDELLGLRDLLFPEGAAHTQKTYRGEAGHAALVAARLDANLQARLKAVSLQEKSLLDLVNQWLGVAKQLGDLEEERARLSQPSSSSAAEINNARLGWVRVANALVANAELAGLDDDTDRLLFSALRAAEHTLCEDERDQPAFPRAAASLGGEELGALRGTVHLAAIGVETAALAIARAVGRVDQATIGAGLTVALGVLVAGVRGSRAITAGVADRQGVVVLQ
jgi:hypothetical protein